MIRLSKTQRAQVKVTTQRLLDKIHKEAITVRFTGRGPIAHYNHEKRMIVFGRPESNQLFDAKLEMLFTLAHEYGHHVSYLQHQKVGREDFDQDRAPEVLFEEMRAWQRAGAALAKVGLRSAVLFKCFTLAAGAALATNVEDFEAHFWLEDALLRNGIRCPKCKRRPRVFGLQSERSLHLECSNRRCHVHTRRASASFLAKHGFERLCVACKED